MLTLSIVEIFFASRTQERGDGVFRDSIKQHHLPSECRSGNSCRPNRMTGIVVAVTECPLAILPGLSPVNGGEPEEKCAIRKRGQQTGNLYSRKFSAQFEPMFLWCIMIETRFEIESVELWHDEIAFGRMEIPGRWITPQRPLRFPCLLPSRQCKSKFKESGKRSYVERLAGNRPRLVDGVIGRRLWLFVWLQQRQRNERCPFKSTKWIRLIGPIEIPKRTSIAVEMMLGLDVIVNHAIDGIGRHSLDWFAVQGDVCGHRNSPSQSTEPQE